MARGDFPSSKQDQFMIRFPEGMRERIKAAADENNRSMNAEIVARLEESFENSSFDIALSQNKTLIEQGKTIEAQSEALKWQSEILQSWQNDLQKMESTLSYFALVFDEASRGDDGNLKKVISKAKNRPLPDRLRRNDQDDK